MKTLFLILFTLFISMFLCEDSYSQEYIQNIAVSQNGTNISIQYKLHNPNKKGYIDQKRRLKGNKFTVKLYYTIDFCVNGKNLCSFSLNQHGRNRTCSRGSGKSLRIERSRYKLYIMYSPSPFLSA